MRLAFVPSSALVLTLLAGCGGSATSSSAPAAKPSTASAAASAQPASSASATAKPAAIGLTKIKAAYSQVSAAQGALYITIDNGIFAKYGLDVDLSQVAGTQQVPALQAGELQIGTP